MKMKPKWNESVQPKAKEKGGRIYVSKKWENGQEKCTNEDPHSSL